MKPISTSTPQPRDIGSLFDGKTITDVTEHDPSDVEMPYQYMLSDGTLVWIDESLKD